MAVPLWREAEVKAVPLRKKVPTVKLSSRGVGPGGGKALITLPLKNNFFCSFPKECLIIIDCVCFHYKLECVMLNRK